MKRPKTSNKKISWFGIVSVFMLAVALAVSVSTNAQAASGSFDRSSYLPQLGGSDFDRAWISVTDSTANTDSTAADSVTVTIKALSSGESITYKLKESGGSSTVFTTSGSTQPSVVPIGSSLGYAEDFMTSGGHPYPGLGTGSSNFLGAVNIKTGGLVSSTPGDATTSSEATLRVNSSDTLALVYSGSTLTTANVGFNGADNSSIVQTTSAGWGDSVTGLVTAQASNVKITIIDPDENLNPKLKDVIGFADGVSAGLTNVGASRVQVEALDQTSSTFVQLSGDLIARNIMLVETGLNTGTFIATGNVYGTTAAVRNGNVNIQGWPHNDTNAYGTTSYAGQSLILGTSTAVGLSTRAYVKFRVIEASASGRLGLYDFGTSTGVTHYNALGFITPSTATHFPYANEFGQTIGVGGGALGTVTVAIGTYTTVHPNPNIGTVTVASNGLVKLIYGSDYCLVKIEEFGSDTTDRTGGLSQNPFGGAGATWESGSTGGVAGANGGSVTVTVGSFALGGTRSGDTIRVSYLDELTAGGSVGTITTVNNFGTTGVAGSLSVNNTTADINDFIVVSVVDSNLNNSTTAIESVALGSTLWGGTTTSRGNRLIVKGWQNGNSEGTNNMISIAYPNGTAVGTQTIRISNTDNSLVWIVPTTISGASSTGPVNTFNVDISTVSDAVGSTTFSLGTQTISTIPLVRGTAGNAKTLLSSASTSSFIATTNGLDNTVEISPDGTHWISIPVVESTIDSGSFVGTLGFDFTAARVTTNSATTNTTAVFTDAAGTSTITFSSDSADLSSVIGTGSVVRISDGTFNEVREVTRVTGHVLAVTKMSNTAYYTPWKTWVQVVGHDMASERLDTVSGSDVFRIGGYKGATYRLRYNDVSGASSAYAGGDTLATTASNVSFTTSTGSLSVSPTGTVGLNSQLVVTLVDNDLNTSAASKQTTHTDSTWTNFYNANENGLGNPLNRSSTLGTSPRKNGNLAKEILVSRASTVTSSDFASVTNTVPLYMSETANNSGTFLGTLQLSSTGPTASSSTSAPVLKSSNGDTITIFYNDSPNSTSEDNSTSYTTVSVSAIGGLGTLATSKSEAFLSGDSVVVTLVDNDLNTTSGIDKATTSGNASLVKATPSSDDTSGTGRQIMMTETAGNSGTFLGTFKTSSASDTTDTAGGTAPNIRSVANGTVIVKYSDASPASDVTTSVTTKNFGATLAFSADSVALEGNAVVSLYDPETNTSITAENVVNVNVKSTTDSSGTTLRLTETGKDTGSFLGTIAASASSTLVNTRIKSAVGDTVTATFTDNPNASGSISTVTDTVTVGVAAATPTPTPGPATPTPTPGPATPTPTPTPTPGPTPTTGAIQVTVISSAVGQPIAGATVTVDGAPAGTTGADGTLLIPAVEAGDHTVTASATGFESSSQTVTVTAGGVATVTFDLVLSGVTPTPTVTPTPVCDAPEAISVSPTSLSLKRKKSGDVTVTVTCDDEGLEGQDVTATINAAGKKRISITPKSATTDASGAATFTITAKKKTGSARVTFKAGSVKKSMTVKVRK